MQTDSSLRALDARVSDRPLLRETAPAPEAPRPRSSEGSAAHAAREPFGAKMAHARRIAERQCAQAAPDPRERDDAAQPEATTRPATGADDEPGAQSVAGPAAPPPGQPIPQPVVRSADAATIALEAPSAKNDAEAAASSAEADTATAALAATVTGADEARAGRPAWPRPAAHEATALPGSPAAADAADSAAVATDGAHARDTARIDVGAASRDGDANATTHRTTAPGEFATRLAQVAAAGWSQPAPANGPASATADIGLAATPSPMAHVAVPVTHPAFQAGFAGEVASLALAGLERAEITVQPPELGPVRIELSLNGEATRIAFSAAQPETRQAIERSLPVLKDMLAEHGLLLSDASVSQGRPDARPGNGSADHAAQERAPDGAGGPGHGRDTARGGLPGPARIARGLLDLYA